MKKKINDLILERKICSVYSNESKTSVFSVGYILAKDNDFILLENISPHGVYDGLSCICISEIYMIEEDNGYLLSLEKIYEPENPKIEIKENVLDALLLYAKENKKICSFELYDSYTEDALGFVKSFDDFVVEIVSFDIEKAKLDGTCTIDKDSISYLSCDEVEDRDMCKI